MSKTRFIISIILKIIVAVCAIWGVLLGIFSDNEFMGGYRTLLFFTIQSNIGIAIGMIVGLILMIKKINLGKLSQIFKLVGTVSITLTGVVFCIVLAPTLKSEAWNLENVFTHVIVPSLSVVDLFVVGVNYKYKYLSVLYVCIPPLLYLVFCILGYIYNLEFIPGMNYPYFFMNWGSSLGAFGFGSELPFMGTMWWILVLLVFVLGVGYLYAFIINKISSNRMNNEASK